MKLYHGTNYSSAINIVNHGIDLKYSRPYFDFGPGFYTTPSYNHAALTAVRAARKADLRRHKKGEEPYIVEISYHPRTEEQLSVNSYTGYSPKWGQFVLNNRLTPDIINGKRVKRMTIADIAEFKGFVKDTLIKKYDMNEMEAACAVRDSCLSEALETDNDFVEHDTIEDWAAFIYEEVNGSLLQMM